MRTVVGRKVKSLRSKGVVPATIYGRNVKSVSVSVAHDAFAKVYTAAGSTGLVELGVDKDVRPVLIHNVQTDPVTNEILHVEFFQVDLKEKVRTNVPLEVAGEAPAVTQKLGVLLVTLNDVEVEALPTELPEKIAIDVSELSEVDQEIKVASLHVPPSVTVLTDANLTVAKIGPLVTKEAEAQAAEEAAAAVTAQTSEEGEQAAAEGSGAETTQSQKGTKSENTAPPSAEDKK